MAGAIKHKFVSPVVDEGVTGEVGPVEWNDRLAVSEGADADVMVRRTALSDGWELIKLGSAVIWINVTAAGNSGAGETDLHSYTIPAGHFAVDKKAIRVKAWGDFAANANVKTLRFKVGGTTVVCNPTTTAPNAKNWSVEATIFRTGASAELVFVDMQINGIAQEQVTNATPAENTANAIIVKFTGQATSNNDIRQLGSMVEYVN